MQICYDILSKKSSTIALKVMSYCNLYKIDPGVICCEEVVDLFTHNIISVGHIANFRRDASWKVRGRKLMHCGKSVVF